MKLYGKYCRSLIKKSVKIKKMIKTLLLSKQKIAKNDRLNFSLQK